MTVASPLWITEAEVVSLLNLSETIAALERGLGLEARGEAANMAKTHATWGSGNTLHTIGATFAGAGFVGTKTWAHTAGGATPLLILFDSETGALKAVIEAFALGQMRTGGIYGALSRSWPTGYHRVPFWLYSDPEVYEREQQRIFAGPSWCYVALTTEIPRPGDFKRSVIGDKPVVVTRDKEGGINVVVNRCAHRGVQFCRRDFGNTSDFMCPYHQWTYDLKGNLRGVPFRRGLRQQGGMPEDFKLEEHALQHLQVTERHGVIFASFDPHVPSFEEYLSPSMLFYFDRVFDGRELRVLGYMRQRIRSNWKLMFENIKDPYHASLLHVFLVTFGLFRADQPSAVKMDETGRHAVLVSRRGEQKASEGTQEIKSFRANFTLTAPRLLTPVKEFPGDATVVMQTL